MTTTTTTTKPRAPKIVDLLAELVAELRLSNDIRLLELPTSALSHDKGARATDPVARARVDRRNALRARIRTAARLEDER